MFLSKLFKEYKDNKVKLESMEKYGYYIAKRGSLYYTVGLSKGKKPDVEIKLAGLSEAAAKSIIHYFVSSPYNLRKLASEDAALETINGDKTYFKFITSDPDNYRIRIILADENNLAPWDKKCSPRFKSQWTVEDRFDSLIILDDINREEEELC